MCIYIRITALESIYHFIFWGMLSSFLYAMEYGCFWLPSCKLGVASACTRDFFPDEKKSSVCSLKMIKPVLGIYFAKTLAQRQFCGLSVYTVCVVCVCACVCVRVNLWVSFQTVSLYFCCLLSSQREQLKEYFLKELRQAREKFTGEELKKVSSTYIPWRN